MGSSRDRGSRRGERRPASGAARPRPRTPRKRTSLRPGGEKPSGRAAPVTCASSSRSSSKSSGSGRAIAGNFRSTRPGTRTWSKDRPRDGHRGEDRHAVAAEASAGHPSFASDERKSRGDLSADPVTRESSDATASAADVISSGAPAGPKSRSIRRRRSSPHAPTEGLLAPAGRGVPAPQPTPPRAARGGRRRPASAARGSRPPLASSAPSSSGRARVSLSVPRFQSSIPRTIPAWLARRRKKRRPSRPGRSRRARARRGRPRDGSRPARPRATRGSRARPRTRSRSRRRGETRYAGAGELREESRAVGLLLSEHDRGFPERDSVRVRQEDPPRDFARLIRIIGGGNEAERPVCRSAGPFPAAPARRRNHSSFDVEGRGGRPPPANRVLPPRNSRVRSAKRPNSPSKPGKKIRGGGPRERGDEVALEARQIVEAEYEEGLLEGATLRRSPPRGRRRRRPRTRSRRETSPYIRASDSSARGGRSEPRPPTWRKPPRNAGVAKITNVASTDRRNPGRCKRPRKGLSPGSFATAPRRRRRGFRRAPAFPGWVPAVARATSRNVENRTFAWPARPAERAIHSARRWRRSTPSQFDGTTTSTRRKGSAAWRRAIDSKSSVASAENGPRTKRCAAPRGRDRRGALVGEKRKRRCHRSRLSRGRVKRCPSETTSSRPPDPGA